MKVGFGNVYFNGIQKTSNVSNAINTSKVNFKGTEDSLQLSDEAKEKVLMTKKFIDTGYEPQEASLLTQLYTKNKDSYNWLTEGSKYGYPAHWVECLDRNLTPEEAVVYDVENMDDYYYAHSDDAKMFKKADDYGLNYELGKADFTPLELAKEINKCGGDIVTAGMVLKGKLDPKDAQKVSDYFICPTDFYYDDISVQKSEYLHSLIRDNLDKMDLWTSDEKDESGKLKSGLIRPLTGEEATELIISPYVCKQDTDFINDYLAHNAAFGATLKDVADFNLSPSFLNKALDNSRKFYDMYNLIHIEEHQ